MDTRLFILLILSALLGLSASSSDNNTTPPSGDWGTITVQTEGGDALLQWTPGPAQQPDRFLIQKKGEGTAFRALRQVMAGSDYRFREPAEKGAAYRVILIDTEGKWSYSPTVLVGGSS